MRRASLTTRIFRPLPLQNHDLHFSESDAMLVGVEKGQPLTNRLALFMRRPRLRMIEC